MLSTFPFVNLLLSSHQSWEVILVSPVQHCSREVSESLSDSPRVPQRVSACAGMRRWVSLSVEVILLTPCGNRMLQCCNVAPSCFLPSFSFSFSLFTHREMEVVIPGAVQHWLFASPDLEGFFLKPPCLVWKGLETREQGSSRAPI